MLRREITSPRDQVDVNMRVVRVFRELRDVRLVAVADDLNGAGNLLDERSQLGGLFCRHVSDCDDVTSDHQHDVTLD